MQKNHIFALGAAILLAGVGYYVVSGDGSTLPDDIASGNGRIEATQVDISTKIAGRVKEVLAREGDLVEPGETVATIDVAELQAQLLRAEADVASAQSAVAAARASIEEAKARLVLAEQELARTEVLVEKGHDSQENRDVRVSERNVARANVASAEATLVAQQRSVDAARAVATEIRTQINDGVLKSTVIGRVLYRLAEPGEVLASGGAVMTLVNFQDIYMEIFLPSSQAHRVAIGAEARVQLDILDFAIPATVSFVSPESQFTPKEVETPSEREKLMFRVKVRVPSDLVLNHIESVKTGIRGVAYVRLTRLDGEPSAWPAILKPMPAGLAPETGDTGTH
ncbi:HlyD family efflux transporter periplasmic adaptor subunit [Roseibium sp.]